MSGAFSAASFEAARPRGRLEAAEAFNRFHVEAKRQLHPPRPQAKVRTEKGTCKWAPICSTRNTNPSCLTAISFAL